MSDWIEVNLPFGRQYDYDAAKAAKESYTDFELPSFTKMTNDDLVGWLVEIKDGTQLLIGHVNENGGECDCCQGLMYSDIITRARRIFP